MKSQTRTEKKMLHQDKAQLLPGGSATGVLVNVMLEGNPALDYTFSI